MSKLFLDSRQALRSLLGTPGFTVPAALTLALGIGANTAIFTVVQAVILRPLPFEAPDRLMALRESKLPQLPGFFVSAGNFLADAGRHDARTTGRLRDPPSHPDRPG